MTNERLAQYNTFQENHLGFKGIIAGVADELIPEGYVPDMENLKITVEGIASAVSNPNVLEPPAGITTAPTSIFLWQRDDGSKILIAQYGAELYWWGTFNSVIGWNRITRNSNSVLDSTDKASFAAGMLDELFCVNEKTQCMKITASSGTYMATTLPNGPMGKYMTLWKNRLFVAGVTTFYGTSSTTTTSGTATFPSSKGVVVFSNINLAETTHTPYGLDPTNYDNGWYIGGQLIDLKTPENSECTGLFPVAENLLFFTKSSVHTFSGTMESNFTLYDYYHGANTPRNNAVVGAGGVFYISNDGFYTLSKEPKAISESVRPLIDPSNATVSCAYYDNRVWFLTGGKLVALNAATGNWEKYNLGGLYRYYNNTTQRWEDIDKGIQNTVYAADYLYIGTTTGQILVVGQPNSMTPGYRKWYLKTPVLNQGITTADKRYKTLFVYAKNTSSKIDTSYSVDYGGYMSVTPTISGIQSGSLWGQMYWEPYDEVAPHLHGVWSEANADMEVYKRQIIVDLARTIRLLFQSSSEVGNTNEGALLGYAIVYTPKRKYGVR